MFDRCINGRYETRPALYEFVDHTSCTLREYSHSSSHTIFAIRLIHLRAAFLKDEDSYRFPLAKDIRLCWSGNDFSRKLSSTYLQIELRMTFGALCFVIPWCFDSFAFLRLKIRICETAGRVRTATGGAYADIQLNSSSCSIQENSRNC